jgi:uncharacterized membrane protein YwaF
VFGQKLARVGLSVLVLCHYEYVMQETAIFFAVCGSLYLGGILVLLNKNAGLQFGFVEHIPGAQGSKKLVSISFVLHRT